MLEFKVGNDGTAVLTGRFDAAEADQVHAAFRALGQSITIDCSTLEYISSAGIAVLLETHKRLHGAGLRLRLVQMQPRVRNVFAYAGLDRLLIIE